MNHIKFCLSLLALSISTMALADEALIKQADSGDAEAQFKVATMYSLGELGDNTQENQEKMINYLEKAAEQNHLESIETLSKQYLNMNEYEKAYKWAELASKQGSDTGKSVLAYILYFGEGVAVIDRQKAYSLACETSSLPLSKALLAKFNYTGWFDLKRNLNEAKRLANEAISEKCPQGFMVLADVVSQELFDNHNQDYVAQYEKLLIEGMSKFLTYNELKAKFLLNKSPYGKNPYWLANDNTLLSECSNANSNSGFMDLYKYLFFIKSDKPKALEFLIKAADKGNFEAMAFLYKAYAQGTMSWVCNEKKPELALKYANLALKHNVPEMIRFLYALTLQCKKDNSLKESYGNACLDLSELNKYVKVAADNGCAEMALLYSRKKNLPEDEKKKYVNCALNMGCLEANEIMILKRYKSDSKAAFDLAKHLEKKPNAAVARLYLGYCYLNGFGDCQIDADTGIKKIIDALSMDGVPLKHALTVFKEYLTGSKIEYDRDKAYIWGKIALTSLSEAEKDLNKLINDYCNRVEKEFSAENKKSLNDRIDFLLTANKNHFNNKKKARIAQYGFDIIGEKIASSYFTDFIETDPNLFIEKKETDNYPDDTITSENLNKLISNIKANAISYGLKQLENFTQDGIVKEPEMDTYVAGVTKVDKTKWKLSIIENEIYYLYNTYLGNIAMKSDKSTLGSFSVRDKDLAKEICGDNIIGISKNKLMQKYGKYNNETIKTDLFVTTEFEYVSSDGSAKVVFTMDDNGISNISYTNLKE